MRFLAVALFFLAACAAAEAPAQSEPAAPVAQPAPAPEANVPRDVTFRCAGAFTQGGIAVCQGAPGSDVRIEGESVGQIDANGWIVVGFNREAPAQLTIEAVHAGTTASQRLEIARRQFDIQRIDGLPQQTVTPTDPAVQARIAREAALKQIGFASQAPITGFLDGFIMPVEGGRVSGTWGNQRILNGTPSTPHFGYDIAVPTGTPIRAPAAGVVTLANPDMHYEGGLVFIDHGQGLITMYLHMSRLDVAVGDVVTQGQILGAVGSSGRATGPHLCWRMRWNGRQLDPSVAVQGLATARAELVR